MSINDSKKLCALYYLLTNLEKIGNISASNFQIQKLKVLMPEGKWQLLDNSLVFEKDIYFTVNELQKVLGKENLKTNILHQEVINLVNDVLGWNSLFF